MAKTVSSRDTQEIASQVTKVVVKILNALDEDECLKLMMMLDISPQLFMDSFAHAFCLRHPDSAREVRALLSMRGR
jgi:hypothetical protein